ncbi:MAG: hypothetical protein Q9184_006507 [Pyrenodesmia sp. 2 TL-2023]
MEYCESKTHTIYPTSNAQMPANNYYNGHKKSTHHCPKASKGGCAYDKSKGFCKTHMMACDIDGTPHLLNQECGTCKKRREMKEKREREAAQRDAERRRELDAEAADRRRAQQQARAERPRRAAGGSGY